MDDGMKKLALAGLGLIRLSGKDSSSLVDKLAAVGDSMLNTQIVPNEPLHFDAARYQKAEQALLESKTNPGSASAIAIKSGEEAESTKSQAEIVSEGNEGGLLNAP